MKQFETPLTDEVRAAAQVISVTRVRQTVVCVAGHKLPAGTIKSAWVGPLVEELRAAGRVPRAGIGEASSGCTARAAAWACRRLGIPFRAFLPDDSAADVVAAVEKYGGRVSRTPGPEKLDGAVRSLGVAAAAEGLLPLNQFANWGNPWGIAKCVVPAVAGRLDACRPVVVVASTGTGGSLAGVTLGLRSYGFQVSAVRVRPVGSDGRFSSRVRGLRDAPPLFLHAVGAVRDEVIPDTEGDRCVRWLRARGIAVGLSSGVNCQAAFRVAEREPTAQVVTVFHDAAK